MNRLLVPLILLCLVGGFTAALLYASYDRKSKVGNGQFDERQLIAQGRGFGLGLLVMVLAGLGIYLYDGLSDREIMTAGTAAILLCSAGMTVANIYCIVKDAYVTIRGSRIASLISAGGLGTMMLNTGIKRLREDGPMVDGRLGPCWGYLAIAFMFLSMFICLLVKLLLDWRNRE